MKKMVVRLAFITSLWACGGSPTGVVAFVHDDATDVVSWDGGVVIDAASGVIDADGMDVTMDAGIADLGGQPDAGQPSPDADVGAWPDATFWPDASPPDAGMLDVGMPDAGQHGWVQTQSTMANVRVGVCARSSEVTAFACGGGSVGSVVVVSLVSTSAGKRVELSDEVPGLRQGYDPVAGPGGTILLTGGTGCGQDVMVDVPAVSYQCVP